MKTLKNLIMTYFFGFLAMLSFGTGVLYCWWYAVSVALKDIKIEWLYQGLAFFVVAAIVAILTDKFENRIDD